MAARRGPRGILVTGTHRSGTTWVGRVLSSSPDIAYVHEPFNVDYSANSIAYRFRHWFAHVDDLEDRGAFIEAFEDTLDFRYVRPVRPFRPWRLRALGRHAADRLRNRSRRAYNRIPLIKDPIALLSAEFLAERFGLEVVCMIRHPLGFCGSLKKWNWTFAFSNLLEQPRAMERYFSGQATQIEAFAREEKDIVSQAILLWNLLHGVIRSYQEAHPDWIYTRHEDLAADPVGGFRGIHERLGIPFTPQIEEGISKSTTSSEGMIDAPAFTRRDPSRVTRSWKERLEGAEIERIVAGTALLRRHFYPDHEDVPVTE